MWTNWAGNQTDSTALAQPRTLDELRAALAQPGTLRPAGSGHSFTPLIPGAARILQMDRFEVPTVGATGTDTAWVNANAQLCDLSPALGEKGLAFRNLGDINVQSLAGAASTATHGTGQSLPCLAAEVQAARIMTASGDILDSTSRPELLPALQVSLGLLGVLLEVQLSLVPRYNLRRQVNLAPLPETLEEMHRHWAENRHFEFFYLPFGNRTIQLRHNISDAPEGKAPIDLDNLAVLGLRMGRNLGRLHPAMRRWVMNLLMLAHSDEDYVGESWRVLCSARGVRFTEMEYHLPVDCARDVLEEVIKRTEAKHPHIYFPIEVRQTAGDTAWLSPFQGAGRISVAIHGDAREGDRGYFADIEPVFRAAGGRPHWGKMHTLEQRELADLYPDFDKFCQVREALDPAGKFLSPAMARMFGAPALAEAGA